MRLLKTVLAGLMLVCCLLFVNEKEAYATPVQVHLDGCDGTFHTSEGYDMFDEGRWIEPGSTLAASGFSIADPTCAGRTFLNWTVSDFATGAPLGTGLSTADVLNYVVPANPIRFDAQWQMLPGGDPTAITYAALYNVTGEVDYNVRVTHICDGVRYSGMGFVTIPQSIYSTWVGPLYTIWEFPGEYINANYQYIPDYFDVQGSVAEFIYQKSCYQTMFKASGEAEVLPSREVVNAFYHQASTVMPEISKVAVDAATTFSADPSVVPAGSTISAEIFTSGPTYEKASFAAKDSLGSGNILVFDVVLKDANGTAMHQLTDFVEVKMNVPADFTIQNGNTIVVYYLADDGTMTPCETVYDDSDPNNRFLTFKTNHFSTYVFVEVPEIVETEPETESVEETEAVVETDEPIDEEEKETVEDAEIMPGKDGGISPIWFVVIALGVSIATAVIVIVVRTKNLRK